MHRLISDFVQVGKEKLVNARYCERFPVVRWKDGRVVHVQVTPEVHRNYEARMQVALDCFQKRYERRKLVKNLQKCAPLKILWLLKYAGRPTLKNEKKDGVEK